MVSPRVEGSVVYFSVAVKVTLPPAELSTVVSGVSKTV
jgi:hypothetical protein